VPLRRNERKLEEITTDKLDCLPRMSTQWQHVMVGTRCSWLHGDERGFRSRGHRVHSSGDYKHRPPSSQHEGLRKYHRERSRKPVSLELEVRIRVAEEFVRKAQSLGVMLIAFGMAKQHGHAVGDFPRDYAELKKLIGKCKQRASHQVRDVLPGTIWSEGVRSEKVNDKEHLHNCYDYIRLRQEAGTVVWSHHPDEDWIKDPNVGVIVMGYKRKRIRVFAKTRSDAGV
jgi:hypothetical protein